MKTILVILMTLSSLSAFADTCLSQAKSKAIAFSAEENKLDSRRIKVTGYYVRKDWRGVIYYGIALSNREVITVGLKKSDCRVVQISFDADGL
jgi:hypothetical protein